MFIRDHFVIITKITWSLKLGSRTPRFHLTNNHLSLFKVTSPQIVYVWIGWMLKREGDCVRTSAYNLAELEAASLSCTWEGHLEVFQDTAQILGLVGVCQLMASLNPEESDLRLSEALLVHAVLRAANLLHSCMPALVCWNLQLLSAYPNPKISRGSLPL